MELQEVTQPPGRSVARVIPHNVVLEIMRGKLLAVADEMGVVLARTSMSPVIYEVLDFACGICDAQGQLVAQTNGITVFTGIFSLEVRALLSKFEGDIHPGDIFMSNNPYVGGTHLNDVAVIKPVFVDGKLFAFALSVSHWTDVGGKAPGSLPADSTEVFQEGLCLPTVRLYSRDKREDGIFDVIAANVRIPRMALGDLNAALASARIADRRIQELCEKYGKDSVRAAFGYILESSERLSRAAVAALPDGVYRATDWIDGDGIRDERFPTRVEVRIEGDQITFDYTGSSPQMTGPVNCSWAALFSAVKTVFKAIVDPQAPSNDGWFRPLQVVAPDGLVFSATRPAATGWYYEATGHASELAWKAVAPLVPNRVSAGSANSLCVTVIGGHAKSGDEGFVLVEPGMVGWGATEERDGMSVVSAITNGDTFNYSLELLEAKFPLRVHQYALNIEGGSGAGRHRGGFGSVREYEILAEQAVLCASFGRSIERPWGMEQGLPGSCNYFEVESNGERWRGARRPTTSLQRGDRVKMVTGGGGGCGDPLERRPEDVLWDVRCGYISIETARRDYGVVIEGDRVDVAATAAARASMGRRNGAASL